jgi:hypothetical protein
LITSPVPTKVFEVTSVAILILEMGKQRFGEVRREIVWGRTVEETGSMTLMLKATKNAC